MDFLYPSLNHRALHDGSKKQQFAQMGHRLWVGLITWGILIVLSACDDQNDLSQCRSDSDCREGYTCDLEIYIGECIRRTEVKVCGGVYCIASSERCIDNTCIPIESAGGESAGSELGGDMTTLPLRELRLTLDPISEAERTTPHQVFEISGQLLTEDGTVPQRVELRLTIVARTSHTELPNELPSEGLALDLDADGRFSHSISLGLGVYEVYLTAIDRGDHDGQVLALAEQHLIIDDFVEVRAGGLYLNNASYRYMGLSIPRLIPWLSSLDDETRLSSLSALMGSLERTGVKVLRVFVGITQGDVRLINDDFTLNLNGLHLLDLIVTEAGKAGMKLVLVLADGAREIDNLDLFVRAGGVINPREDDQNRVFETGLAREALLSWFESIITHRNLLTHELLSDDPTILAWELLHLPRWDFSETLSTVVLEEFLRSAINTVSTVAPHQLIFTGEVGLDYNPSAYQSYAMTLSQGGIPYLLNGQRGGSWSSMRTWSRPPSGAPLLVGGFSLDGDFLDFHLSTLTWNQLGQAWLRGHALANLSAARPLTIHLARVNRSFLGDDLAQQTLIAWAQEGLGQGLYGLIIGDISLSERNDAEPSEHVWGLEEPVTQSWIEAARSRFVP